MRARSIVLPLLLVVLAAVGAPAPAVAHQYFNSTECPPVAGGSGTVSTDPNCLVAEDFEKDQNGNGPPGTWFLVCGGNGFTDSRNKGWGASLTGVCGEGGTNITPPGAVVCGAGVTPFGQCVGSGGLHSGGQGGLNMGEHRFRTSTCGGTGADLCGVDEVYVRWYVKWESGYLWSGEKHMNPTAGDGGIFFANVHCNPGQQSRETTCGFTIANQNVSAQTIVTNSPLTIQSGRWYFAELHMLANTPGQANGLMELWTNDCGVNGTSCGAAPVLRVRITNVNFCSRGQTCGGMNGSVHQIASVFLESWANNGDGVGSLGTGPYWDQVKVSRVGPIGFASSSGIQPPIAPTGLTVSPSAVVAVGTPEADVLAVMLGAGAVLLVLLTGLWFRARGRTTAGR